MDSVPDAGTRPLHSTLDPFSIEARLPCDERSYQLGLDVNRGYLSLHNHEFTSASHTESTALGPAQPGISTCTVKLAVLRMQILQYSTAYHPRNKRRAPSGFPWVLESPFYRYKRQLEDFVATLPSELSFNADNLRRHRTQLIGFLTLHCMFHAVYADLLRLESFVVGPPTDETSSQYPIPPDSFLHDCKLGRLQHAFAITKVISDSLEYLTSEPDPFVSICSCLAVRVLVVERQQHESELLSLTAEAVKSGLDAAVKCAKRTARWSKPVQKMASVHYISFLSGAQELKEVQLFAVSEVVGQHGYHFDLSDVPR